MHPVSRGSLDELRRYACSFQPLPESASMGSMLFRTSPAQPGSRTDRTQRRFLSGFGLRGSPSCCQQTMQTLGWLPPRGGGGGGGGGLPPSDENAAPQVLCSWPNQ